MTSAVRADGGGYLAALRVELHFPAAGSLKAKRKELSSAKAQLRTRHGVAVAEVGYHDRWQRATLLVALTAHTQTDLDAAADRVERYLIGRFPDGTRVQRALASWNDLRP